MKNIIANREIEKEIVNKFIAKGLRERVLFELSSPKRRGLCTSSLCWKVDDRCMIDITKGVNSYETVWNYFKDFGAKPNDDCYVMETEGKIMPLKKAIEDYVFKGFILLYWIKGGIGFLGGEMFSTHGTAIPKYILKSK